MKKENNVSLWLGNFTNEKDFKKFMEIKYTDDVDSISSKFKENFKIQYYDINFSEVDWIEEGLSDFQELLEGFSNDYEIIPKFKENYNDKLEKEYNSIIFLYDFEYDGICKHVEYNGNEIDFIGCVNYNK
ncbi:MAG: immunity 22 family protein [Clostridiaceae bacterium]|nr:immunity 22 family protein [Clostridiaceae bacterium]